jgi:hypothetical protein
MPSIIRRNSAAAGLISKLAVTRVREDMFVTAVRHSAGKLKVIVIREICGLSDPS